MNAFGNHERIAQGGFSEYLEPYPADIGSYGVISGNEIAMSKYHVDCPLFCINIDEGLHAFHLPPDDVGVNNFTLEMLAPSLHQLSDIGEVNTCILFLNTGFRDPLIANEAMQREANGRVELFVTDFLSSLGFDIEAVEKVYLPTEDVRGTRDDQRIHYIIDREMITAWSHPPGLQTREVLSYYF